MTVQEFEELTQELKRKNKLEKNLETIKEFDSILISGKKGENFIINEDNIPQKYRESINRFLADLTKFGIERIEEIDKKLSNWKNDDKERSTI